MSWPARSAPPVAPWRRQPWRVCWFWWRGRLHCWWTWAASKTQKLSAIGSGSDRLSLPPSLVTIRSHSNAQSPNTSVKNVRKRFHQPNIVYSSDIYMECWNVKVCVLQNQRYHTSETALTRDCYLFIMQRLTWRHCLRSNFLKNVNYLNFWFLLSKQWVRGKYVFLSPQHFIMECPWFKSVFRTCVLQAFHQSN